MPNDEKGHINASENGHARTYTQEEVDALLAETRRAAATDAHTNTEPAWEEGPHLREPDVAEAKLKQLREAGIRKNDKRLTPDMKALFDS